MNINLQMQLAKAGAPRRVSLFHYYFVASSSALSNAANHAQVHELTQMPLCLSLIKSKFLSICLGRASQLRGQIFPTCFFILIQRFKCRRFNFCCNTFRITEKVQHQIRFAVRAESRHNVAKSVGIQSFLHLPARIPTECRKKRRDLTDAWRF